MTSFSGDDASYENTGPLARDFFDQSASVERGDFSSLR
jgi:hypothetical protein